jgi:hypothetical protein
LDPHLYHSLSSSTSSPGSQNLSFLFRKKTNYTRHSFFVYTTNSPHYPVHSFIRTSLPTISLTNQNGSLSIGHYSFQTAIAQNGLNIHHGTFSATVIRILSRLTTKRSLPVGNAILRTDAVWNARATAVLASANDEHAPDGYNQCIPGSNYELDAHCLSPTVANEANNHCAAGFSRFDALGYSLPQP